MPEFSGMGASQTSRPTFFYFTCLILFVSLSSPGGSLIDIQTSFLLKNQLHASATQISWFRLFTAIPLYFAFAAGLLRDQWNPLGLRDRGFFLIFAPVTAVVFIFLASSNLSYRGLLVGMLVAMWASRFVVAAYQGLMALIGQAGLMSGRLSALWNAVIAIPAILATFASGYVSQHLRPHAAFALAAGFAGCVGLLALWKPASVFKRIYDLPQARGAGFLANVKRLARHRAVYPAVLICFLWNFAPGGSTPLQFYLANVIHAPDADFSYFAGIFNAASIPTFLLYGLLCKKLSLNKLLWISTIIAVPQWVPFAFVHSAHSALAMAVPIGLLGGLASAAYFDLAMRSCPPGLQGTLMMLVEGVFALSSRGGDLLGSTIYKSSPAHGFLSCVIATTAVYAMILPLILLVPKRLIANADGEPNPEIQAQVPEEVAKLEPA
ncbi:MAG TPA: MFS transporter [Tepidisphaeraceae bacterium]|jgi:hypothetical protein|nr:MFS transporter [Tepidisphaeraceae bacterium]